jgi:hypothetical protein
MGVSLRTMLASAARGAIRLVLETTSRQRGPGRVQSRLSPFVRGDLELRPTLAVVASS